MVLGTNSEKALVAVVPGWVNVITLEINHLKRTGDGTRRGMTTTVLKARVRPSLRVINESMKGVFIFNLIK